jgi:glycosyltransferase A (GT-A) superfamily protein (DUF2064 family)
VIIITSAINRHVQTHQAGNDPANRLEQRMRRAHGELAERIVEIGLDQLQHEAQQHDDQVETDQRLDDKDGGAGECVHQ